MKQFSRTVYAYSVESTEYLERFKSMATQDFAVYGALAGYANDFVVTKQADDRINR